MNQDLLLEKVITEIAGKEREIVDNFCRVFICQSSIDGLDISTLFSQFKLCISHEYKEKMVTRYWFEPKDFKLLK